MPTVKCVKDNIEGIDKRNAVSRYTGKEIIVQIHNIFKDIEK